MGFQRPLHPKTKNNLQVCGPISRRAKQQFCFCCWVNQPQRWYNNAGFKCSRLRIRTNSCTKSLEAACLEWVHHTILTSLSSDNWIKSWIFVFMVAEKKHGLSLGNLGINSRKFPSIPLEIFISILSTRSSQRTSSFPIENEGEFRIWSTKRPGSIQRYGRDLSCCSCCLKLRPPLPKPKVEVSDELTQLLPTSQTWMANSLVGVNTITLGSPKRQLVYRSISCYGNEICAKSYRNVRHQQLSFPIIAI